MSKKLNILVTGGSGLLGNSIKKFINDLSFNFTFISSKDCDLRNINQCNELFLKGNFNIVIHLASLVAGLYGNLDNNYNFYIDNNTMNINIVKCCEKYNITRLINILSTCVFPEQTKFNIINYPLTSDQILNGKPHPSNSGYAHAKRNLYIASKLLTECSNLQVINLIPTNLYGEHDNYNLHKSHVIPALIHKTFLAKLNNKSLIIKGDGLALRQFVYVDDLAKIILKFIDLELEKQCNSLIICPSKNKELSIKELINNIVTIFEFKGKIIYDTDFTNGQKLKTTDSNELLHYFPHFKFTSLNDGLNNTIKYFINNYKNLRH